MTQTVIEKLIQEIVLQEFAALAGGSVAGFVAPQQQTQKNAKRSVKSKKKKENKKDGNRYQRNPRTSWGS